MKLAPEVEREKRGAELEKIINDAATELNRLVVSVTPNTPAYAAVVFAHKLVCKPDPEFDASEIIDED